WSARRRRRPGHLFQGRYKAEMIEDETYYWTVSRYIHLNPVRAALVARPEQWPWSSYPGYVAPALRRPWVRYEAVLAAWRGGGGGGGAGGRGGGAPPARGGGGGGPPPPLPVPRALGGGGARPARLRGGVGGVGGPGLVGPAVARGAATGGAGRRLCAGGGGG